MGAAEVGPRRLVVTDTVEEVEHGIALVFGVLVAGWCVNAKPPRGAHGLRVILVQMRHTPCGTF